MAIVVGEGDGPNLAGVPVELADFLASLGIEEPQVAVVAGGDESFGIGRKGAAVDGAAVDVDLFQLADDLADAIVGGQE